MKGDMEKAGDRACVIIPFQPRHAGYDPGVVPFDSGNPDHIRAWNSLFAMARSEQHLLDRGYAS